MPLPGRPPSRTTSSRIWWAFSSQSRLSETVRSVRRSRASYRCRASRFCCSADPSHQAPGTEWPSRSIRRPRRSIEGHSCSTDCWTRPLDLIHRTTRASAGWSGTSSDESTDGAATAGRRPLGIAVMSMAVADAGEVRTPVARVQAVRHLPDGVALAKIDASRHGVGALDLELRRIDGHSVVEEHADEIVLVRLIDGDRRLCIEQLDLEIGQLPIVDPRGNRLEQVKTALHLVLDVSVQSEDAPRLQRLVAQPGHARRGIQEHDADVGSAVDRRQEGSLEAVEMRNPRAEHRHAGGRLHVAGEEFVVEPLMYRDQTGVPITR